MWNILISRITVQCISETGCRWKSSTIELYRSVSPWAYRNTVLWTTHKQQAVTEDKLQHISHLNLCFSWCDFDRASSLICGNKIPTRCNRGFLSDLIACSTCFGHHYAHHQELKSIIQWLLPVVFRAVVFKLLVWCETEGYVSGLQDAGLHPH